MHMLRCRNGFTLPETLVSLMMTAVLSGMMLAAYFTGAHTWGIGSAQLDAQESWRNTVTWITDDLRQSGSSVILNVPPNGQSSATIRFLIAEDVQNKTTAWDPDLVEYALINQSLQRSYGNEVLVIAENIRQVRFIRNDPKVVEVNLQASGKSFRGTIDDSINFQIRMRN